MASFPIIILFIILGPDQVLSSSTVSELGQII